MSELIHSSNVSEWMLAEGELTMDQAVAFAELLDAEAFLWEVDSCWYAFDEYDEDTEQPEINWFRLSPDRYQRFKNF